MVVPVIIEGEQYDFLLDTGAPTVVSTELASKLNLPIVAEQQVADSEQASGGMSFSRVPSITLGGVDFTNIGVGITDLNASTDITCLEIDGLIGANFLRKAEWKFDYEHEKIEFASSLDAFEVDATSLEVPLGFTLTKTPVMTVRLGDKVKEKRVAVDLGSNGGFSLNMESYRSLEEESPHMNYSVEYGVSGGGLFDNSLLDTTYTSSVAGVSFGGVQLDSATISFEEQEMSTVGSGFFEDYDVVISWKKKRMWLIPKATNAIRLYMDHGVTFAYTDDQLVVRKLQKGSAAARYLKIGDHVISFDGQSYESLSQQEYCAFVQSDGPQKDSVFIVVDRAGEQLGFVLTKVE